MLAVVGEVGEVGEGTDDEVEDRLENGPGVETVVSPDPGADPVSLGGKGQPVVVPVDVISRPVISSISMRM